MKNHFKRLSVILVSIFFVLSLSARDTRVVETKHFKIIYDERTENAAKEVFSFSERAYEELVSFFDEDPKIYLPIYIEPDEKDYNAYFTTFPYNRIVIYDAPLSSSLDNTENTLYMTFLHELTHAFTFSFKGGVGEAFTSIFGDWANIGVNLHMYLFMQEGISVYTESRDGGGRLNDPFFYTPLIQARLEEKDISYLDASGGRDIMPVGDMWYLYGGAFTDWMQKRYGEREVASYYKTIAKNLFSFPQNGYSSTFSNKLWNDWERFWGEIKVPESYFYPFVITEESRKYSDLAIHQGKLYALSSSKEALLMVNEKEERVLSTCSNVPDLSIGDDGSFLIPYVSEEESYVSLYNENGKREKKYDGYYDGTFYSSGVLLASTVDRITKLTLLNERDEVEKEMTLGRDVTLHEFTSTEIGAFFLLSRKGEESIAYLDESGELYLLSLPKSLVFSSLSSDSTFLTFSYIEKGGEGELGKYGEIDISSFSLNLSEKEFFGGVNYPIRDEENVYFVSTFFDHSAISKCSYSELEVKEKGECRLISYSPLYDEYCDYDINAISSRYNPLSTMTKGALIPLFISTSTFFEPSQVIGLSWITEDATEEYFLISSAGYVSSSDSFSFGASLYNNWFSLSFSGDLSSSFFNYESDISASFSFPLSHSGEKISIEDTLGWVKYYEKGMVLNHFSFSYENIRQRGMGRYHTLGWGAKVEALNLNPSLTLFMTYPGILPYNPTSILDWAIPFTLKTKIGLDSVVLSSRFHLLTMEIQKSVRLLSLYFTHMDLYAESQLDYFYKGELKSKYSLGLTSTLSPILGQMSRFKVEIGAELNYNKESGITVKLVLGAS